MFIFGNIMILQLISIYITIHVLMIFMLILLLGVVDIDEESKMIYCDCFGIDALIIWKCCFLLLYFGYL